MTVWYVGGGSQLLVLTVSGKVVYVCPVDSPTAPRIQIGETQARKLAGVVQGAQAGLPLGQPAVQAGAPRGAVAQAPNPARPAQG